MKRGGPTRLGIGLMVLVVATVMIGGLVWVGKTFFGGQNTSNSETVSAGQKLLDKPTTQTTVRLSVRGPITAQEAHYSIALTINANSRNLVIWRGYDGTIITQENLTNSSGSFNDLLAALNRAGMMKENKNAADTANQGICAVGQVIQFEVLDGEKSTQKLWTTSCQELQGNFDGLTANVIDLFLDQVPDARNRIAAAKDDLDVEARTGIGNPWDGLAAFN